MIIEIPDKVFETATISQEDLKREVALLMYEKWIWGLMEARTYCGMNRMAFQQLLLDRKIPIQYSIEDLNRDLNQHAGVQRQTGS